MQNYSYENDFDLRENETACRTHFHMKDFALRLVLKQIMRQEIVWAFRWNKTSGRNEISERRGHGHPGNDKKPQNVTINLR